MRGQKIGYVRISSVDQNTGRQLAGLELDKIFTDKASGKDTKRQELMTLLDYARQGDSIYIHSMDRLARNLDDLRKIVKNLTEKGIEIHFLNGEEIGRLFPEETHDCFDVGFDMVSIHRPRHRAAVHEKVGVLIQAAVSYVEGGYRELRLGTEN